MSHNRRHLPVDAGPINYVCQRGVYRIARTLWVKGSCYRTYEYRSTSYDILSIKCVYIHMISWKKYSHVPYISMYAYALARWRAPRNSASQPTCRSVDRPTIPHPNKNVCTISHPILPLSTTAVEIRRSLTQQHT